MPAPGAHGHAFAVPRLRSVLRRRWRRFDREARRLGREGPTEPAVHDCRVAGRRLMTLLRLLEATAPASGARGLRRGVRRSFRALARLRDVQVEQALAAPYARRHPVLHDLLRRLAREERQLQRSVHGVLNDAERQELRLRFTKLMEHAERQGTASAQAAVLGRELQRSLSALAATVIERNDAACDGDPEALHQVRIALKKFRFLLEAERSLDGDAMGRRIERAKRWQARLGRLQDLRVLRDDARTQAGRALGAEWEAALRELDAALAAETRAYLAVRRRLDALVAPFRHGADERLAV